MNNEHRSSTGILRPYPPSPLAGKVAHLLPSPLAGEGPGVRGDSAKRHSTTLTPTLSHQGRGSRNASSFTRRGFTLIELMVTIGIMAILFALTALALSGAKESAQIAATKSLIARLNVLVMQKYESYRYRRLPIQIPPNTAPQVAAQIRCDAIRQLMRLEMPDRWTDITDGPVTMTGSTTMLRPAVSQAYFAFYSAVSGTAGYLAPAADGGLHAGDEFQGAKCLYLIVTMGLEESDVMENFNSSEYKDYDGSGCKVFVDAWGKPIRFLRWAPGFMAYPATGAPSGGFSGVSRLQTGWDRDQTDPTGVYGSPPPLPAGTNAATIDQPATTLTTANTYALYPLIYSAGPDGYYDIISDSTKTFHYASVPGDSVPNDPFGSVKDTSDFPNGPIGAPSVVDTGQSTTTLSHYDNIHNHQLGAR